MPSTTPDRAAPSEIAPATKEIEVTPEMIDAGAAVLGETNYSPLWSSLDDRLTAIFRAMYAARSGALGSQADRPARDKP